MVCRCGRAIYSKIEAQIGTTQPDNLLTMLDQRTVIIDECPISRIGSKMGAISLL